jgi:GNAT superfamily N-acetyltransferase
MNTLQSRHRQEESVNPSSDYRISTDRTQLDVPLIHRFLSQESYWARTVPLNVVERSIAHSLCFGLYRAGCQIGFARVVTDAATFGYLADVFVVAPYRGKGLGRRLIEAVVSHPDLQGLQHFLLATRDGRKLYRQFGFITVKPPRVIMEMGDSDIQLSHGAASQQRSLS